MEILLATLLWLMILFRHFLEHLKYKDVFSTTYYFLMEMIEIVKKTLKTSHSCAIDNTQIYVDPFIEKILKKVYL